jgi:hypothetical protein
MRNQIANLILGGATKEQILSVVGIPSAQLEELLEEPSFRREIREVKESQKEQDIESKLQNLELSAIKKVSDNMEFYDAQSLCRVLETVSRTRQMKKQASQPANPHANGMLNATINIAIPAFLGNSQVLMDSKKQVVSIDGRNMAPLPTAQVKQLFSQIENQHERPKASAANGKDSEDASSAAA